MRKGPHAANWIKMEELEESSPKAFHFALLSLTFFAKVFFLLRKRYTLCGFKVADDDNLYMATLRNVLYYNIKWH